MFLLSIQGSRCRKSAPGRASSGSAGLTRGVRNVTSSLACVCALVFCWSAGARAEWLADIDAGARYESNLTRAQRQADVRADTAATLSAFAARVFAITGADLLTLHADADTEAWARFHGLNLISIGAGATYKHKFGVGLAVPWIGLAASAFNDRYRGAIRDSRRFEASAELGQRFSEIFDASADVAYDRRDARSDQAVVPGISGRVFDLRGRSARVRAAYAVTDQLQLDAAVAVRRGDVVSTTRQNFAIFLASDAIAPDPSFGDDFFAYRLRGTTRSAAATSSWALSSHSSISVRYADELTRAFGGLDYRGRSTTLTLAVRY